MGLRDRINAARTERAVRDALADLVDNPTETGANGRAATLRLHQAALREAQQRTRRAQS